MRCFACDTEIPVAAGERVGFRDSCESCGGDLHVCRNCEHHDPGAHNQCREPGTEPVSDRERANHCDWFSPSDRGGGEAARAAAGARASLDDLFKK